MVWTIANTTTVTRNGIGARGIDYQSTTTSSGASVSYPLYDAHGNMVATLAKSSGTYAVSNRRAYDAWGVIRQGATSGDPKGRYCASIGHVADDESDLVYMRSRYYEARVGRFISSDARMHRDNWYLYCGSDPVNRHDATGKEFTDVSYLTVLGGGLLFSVGLIYMALALMRVMAGGPSEIFRAAKLGGLGVALSAMGAGTMDAVASGHSSEFAIGAIFTGTWAGAKFGAYYFNSILSVFSGASVGGKSAAAMTVFAVSMYSLTCLAFIASLDFEGSNGD
jgi:RHS repeat-associated protein